MKREIITLPQMTIFSAEAYAIYNVLKHIQTNNIIYTNSMSIIKTSSNTVKKDKNDIVRNMSTFYMEPAPI